MAEKKKPYLGPPIRRIDKPPKSASKTNTEKRRDQKPVHRKGRGRNYK